MQTRSVVNRHAPRFLLTCTILFVLAFSTLAPSVAAQDTTSYTATQIHDWLVDQVSGATVEITDATAVILNSGDYGEDPESNYVRVDGVRLNVLGVSIGISPIKFMFEPGTTNVLIRAELDLFGISPAPKLECKATVSCVGPDGPLEIEGIDAASVKIGSFEPTLSSDDITAIVDVLNQIIAASGLEVTPPTSAAELQGISVAVTPSLHLEWSEGGPTDLEASYLQTKINGMVGTLETKATNYLQEGEGNWNVDVEVVSDASLDIAASLTAFGITATLDVPIEFSTLTATITSATFTIGNEAPKTVTFSAEALVSCSNYIPSIAMQSLVLGDEHPGLRDYIAGIVGTVMTAIDDAVDDIVAYTLLELPYYSISDIAIVGTNVVLTSTGDVTVDLILKAGWNMVSVPVTPDDTAVSTVFAGSIAVYTWDPVNKTYVVPTSVDPAQGYWVAVTTDRTINVTGTPVSQWACGLLTGWSMVGSVQPRDVPIGEIEVVPAGSIITSAIYGWDPIGKSYLPAVALETGHGYWMASTGACDITVS